MWVRKEEEGEKERLKCRRERGEREERHKERREREEAEETQRMCLWKVAEEERVKWAK